VRLLLTPAAQADLIAIARYLTTASKNRTVGLAFAKALREKCERLAELPGQLGRERLDLGANIRSFPFKGYIVVFRYENDTLEVARVLSGRQDIAALFSDSASDS
jgi:toxin ParE1/3/4